MNKIIFQPIKNIMTSKVICVSSEDTLDRVQAIFSEKKIHHLPVLDLNNSLIGLISTSDLDKACWGKSMIMETDNLDSTNQVLFRTYRTVDIMSEPVITLSPSDFIKDAILKFMEGNFRAIPIVHKNEVVGILSPLDILNHLI